MIDNNLSYEKTHKLIQPVFVVVIVNPGQDKFYRDLFHELDAAIVLSTHGRGTRNLLSEIFNSETDDKRIIFTLLQKNKWNEAKKKIEERFSISYAAKGIAFEIPLESIAGVSIYKWITNNKKLEKPIKNTQTKKKSTNVKGEVK